LPSFQQNQHKSLISNHNHNQSGPSIDENEDSRENFELLSRKSFVNLIMSTKNIDSRNQLGGACLLLAGRLSMYVCMPRRMMAKVQICIFRCKFSLKILTELIELFDDQPKIQCK
jgi:hypothetical protein